MNMIYLIINVPGRTDRFIQQVLWPYTQGNCGPYIRLNGVNLSIYSGESQTEYIACYLPDYFSHLYGF